MGYVLVFLLTSVGFYTYIIGIGSIIQSVFPIDLGILAYSMFLSTIVNFPVWVIIRLFVVIVSWLFEGVDRVAFIIIWIFCSIAVFLGGAGFLYYHSDIQTEFYNLLSPVIPEYWTQVMLTSGVIGGILAALFIGALSDIEVEEPVRQQAPQRIPQRPRVTEQPRVANLQVHPVPVPPVPESPRPAQMPSIKAVSQPIWLENLTLLAVKASGGGVDRTRIVNTHTDTAIRPVAVVLINDVRLGNARFSVQFDLVSPSGEIVYRQQMRPLFKLGRNVIVPQQSEYGISEGTAIGTWSLRIWAGNYQWGELFFPVTTRVADSLGDTVSTDMEMSDDTLKRANQLASQFSIDELLNS